MTMTMFNDELTLPGVITQIVPDYLSGYDTSAWGTTESVTIIGTAFNGPVGKQTAVYTPEQAKYIFGDSFDAKTKRETSLVPAIYDAWEKGCRTIYAVRVSGKEMYKDFELATETSLKLRLNGSFPCNDNKSCFMTYQMKQGSESSFGTSEGVIRIYKPADRTVISEKLAGVVDSMDSILVTEINLDANGFDKNSRLCDVMDLINNLETNNVLTLSLVDENGVPRTNATKEVQEIPVGALFPGIYTICRDEVPSDVKLVTDIELIRSDTEKLFPNHEDKLWKKLVINTDPAKPYPIGANLINDLKANFPAGLTIDENYDFLKKNGAIDTIATKNSVDYEEVDIDPFELYQKLGSGFVRTARLKEVGTDEITQEKKYKVIPSPDGDEYKVKGIEDGIYSVLQMHETDYTVLVAATAETKIDNKLPKKNDFKKARPSTFNLKNPVGSENIIVGTTKIDVNDITSSRIKYVFSIKKLSSTEKPTSQDVISKLSTKKYKRLPVVTEAITPSLVVKDIKNGTLFFNSTDFKLYKVVNDHFVQVDASIIGESRILANEEGQNKLSLYEYNQSTHLYEKCKCSKVFTDGIYISAMSNDKSLIYKVLNAEGNVISESDKSTPEALAYAYPVMSLQDLVNGTLDDDDTTLVAVEDNYALIKYQDISKVDDVNVTYVTICSTELEYSSVEEFVDTLNSHEQLKNKFSFESASTKATENMPESLNGNTYNKEEKTFYDTSLYIPYTTTDNFARQLAQHCLYTSLKTYPTHGIIGCERLASISLSTIASRIDEICSLNLDMYAKKSNGNNMLDSKNIPHPIGRCVSITFMQYTITTGNGYNYISSGAAGYAGMISTLDPDKSSTNQSININELMFSLSNYQLTKLNSAGIVCCRESTNGMVVVDGITQAPVSSTYRRLSTTKIINAVGRILKQVIEPYIGLPQTLAYLNSMETAIKSALNKIVGVLINDYSYNIVTDSNAAKLGIVKIDYVIVPAYEIREVRNTVTITSNNM